ncbi:MAG TPA: hypothetical protein VHF87_06530 [Methylomirabilota bacterium]|nr:hypothetical protein [Methylomirabilota bacterium]
MRRARAVRAVVSFAALCAVLVLAAPPARAESPRRYSGRVMEVDLERGVLVVEELGRRGVPTRHQVRVEAETPMVTASRLRLGDMRGQSAFGEVPVSLVDVLVGDFVVVEGEDQDGLTVARRVTIVETRRIH